MKTDLIAIVVLSLTAAHSPAFGQDPGSEGNCVIKCLWPDDAGTSVARSALQQLVQRSSELEARCQETEKTLTCVEGCQADRYVTLAREVSRIWDKYCGDNVDEATGQKFLADGKQFTDAWFSEEEKCQGHGTTPEETCKEASDCVFGSALAAAKNGFSFDVVSVNVNMYKIAFGAAVDVDDPPRSCDVIFEPYQPEPPYEPEAYPYETYEPEPYQRNPYQRNPYQRNPYQRNSYQRNPYQRNPYQRKPYQRNPYN